MSDYRTQIQVDGETIETLQVLGSKVFVFPMPGTPCKKDDADKYMLQLKKLIYRC